jgi:hypothetical protein
MKYALISPDEPREAGYRVADVVATSFEIAPPLFWVECADDVVADVYWYDPNTQQIALIPVPEPDLTIVQPISQGAQTL